MSDWATDGYSDLAPADYYSSPVYGSPGYGSTSSGSSDAWSGFTSLLGNIANTGLNVWAKTTLQQQSIDGQRYIEGQRLAQQQMQLMSQQGGNSSLLLIVALVGVGFMLMKA